MEDTNEPIYGHMDTQVLTLHGSSHAFVKNDDCGQITLLWAQIWACPRKMVMSE
jgi:hypothetical protein